jgi:hypothetical protein
MMETPLHPLSDLFRQLGLADDPASINRFIAAQRPLRPGVALADAPCWNASQSRLLRESLAADADWAEVVDALNVALSA